MRYIFIIATFLFITSCQRANATQIDKHGKLKVIGLQLCSEKGEPVQIKGMSSHGLFWFPHCFNKSVVELLADDWKVDAIRLAMYTKNYIDNPPYYAKQIDKLVDIAEDKGVYCVIDWHVLDPGNPNDSIEHAIEFWEHMSKKHAGKKHVIYEICNEPNGGDWNEVKQYANTIIPLIRKNDPETVILIGTPNWSSDLNAVVKDPLNFENIMYSYHFYAKSHKNYQAFMDAIAKIPVFISEWGTTSYTGNDGHDFESAQKWLDIFAGENPENLKISWMNWNFSDKNEDSAVLKPGSGIRQDWNNLTVTGKWIREQFK